MMIDSYPIFGLLYSYYYLGQVLISIVILTHLFWGSFPSFAPGQGFPPSPVSSQGFPNRANAWAVSIHPGHVKDEILDFDDFPWEIPAFYVKPARFSAGINKKWQKKKGGTKKKSGKLVVH